MIEKKPTSIEARQEKIVFKAAQPELETIVQEEIVTATVKTNGTQSKVKEARAKGYTGEHCSNCGSMRVKRNGSCTVCEDCGTTSGCS